MAERVQRRRIAGEPGMPSGAVYVGRPSLLGNPWHVETRNIGYELIGPDGTGVPFDDRTKAQEAAVLAHRTWLEDGEFAYVEWLTPEQVEELLDRRDQVLAKLPELRGDDLACWCPLDQPCHATVLLEIANG